MEDADRVGGKRLKACVAEQQDALEMLADAFQARVQENRDLNELIARQTSMLSEVLVRNKAISINNIKLKATLKDGMRKIDADAAQEDGPQDDLLTAALEMLHGLMANRGQGLNAGLLANRAEGLHAGPTAHASWNFSPVPNGGEDQAGSRGGPSSSWENVMAHIPSSTSTHRCAPVAAATPQATSEEALRASLETKFQRNLAQSLLISPEITHHAFNGREVPDCVSVATSVEVQSRWESEQSQAQSRQDVAYADPRHPHGAFQHGASPTEVALTHKQPTPGAEAALAKPSSTKSKSLRVKVPPTPLPVGLISSTSSSISAAPGSSNEPVSPAALHQEFTTRAVAEEASRSLGSTEVPPEQWTTAIVRNIPARCSQAQLLKLWPPDGSYNLLFLPYCQKSYRTAGFALVNFLSHEALGSFRSVWQGELLIPGAKVKPLDVAMADLQGLEPNLLHMRRSNKMNRIKHMKHVPVVLNPDGSFADFKVLMQHIRLDGTDASDMQDTEEVPAMGSSSMAMSM